MSCVAAQPTPAPPAYEFSSCLNNECTMHLAWNYDATAKLLHMKIETAYPSTVNPGWAGVGFVPDGQHGEMANGTFVVGYIVDDVGGCVRVNTNGVKPGDLPTGPGDFSVTDTAVSVDGNNMTILATRPFAATGRGHAIVPGVQTVIFAAGSAKASPQTCDAPFTQANYHDLTAAGMIGNRDVDFSAGTLPPTPAPAPAVPPPLGLFCTYIEGFAANVTLYTSTDGASLLTYGDTFAICDEKYTYIPAGGLIDISANYADPTDCFSQLKAKYGGAFIFSWNGTVMTAKNSVFPALYLKHVDVKVCPVVP